MGVETVGVKGKIKGNIVVLSFEINEYLSNPENALSLEGYSR